MHYGLIIKHCMRGRRRDFCVHHITIMCENVIIYLTINYVD